MKIKRIIDISRKIYPGMMVWPGDKGVAINRIESINEGDALNVSSISMSVHTGTHIDAPFHFIDEGKDIASLDMDRFIGFAKVFELNAEKCIKQVDLKKLDIAEGDIVILKTINSSLPEEEPLSEKFIYLDISAAKYLVEKKVKTVGVDHLTVDDICSTDFPNHNLFLSNNIGIIEGVRLKDVSEGNYFLSALPLRIAGVDGSPVRAVLLEF